MLSSKLVKKAKAYADAVYRVAVLGAAVVLFQTTHAFSQQTLSLDEYLQQVRQSHSGLKAAAEITEGASLRSSEGSLLLAPTIIGNAQYTHDEQPRLSPALQGNKSTLSSYSLGFSKLTEFGLKGSLTYNINRTEIFGANSLFTPLSNYYDTKPLLELSFQLWRNRFGGETSADQDRLNAQAMATSFEQSFRLKNILADAEATYWRFEIAQRAVDIQKRSLQRANAIRDWLSAQMRLQLTDRADYLQSVAAVKVRELEVAAAQDNARVAATNFNSLRGIDSLTTDVRLATIDENMISETVPKRGSAPRDDVQAARERERVAQAVATAGVERISPVLELYSQMAFNGRDTLLGESSKDSFSSNYPYAVVGVRLSAPLNLPATFDSRAGYRLEKAAAAKEYDRKVFETQQEWLSLSRNLVEARSRLKLSNEIVAAQEQKLEHERARHRRGRTTTYQVLLFEQDYAAAQLARLQIQSNIIDVLARMKTFGENLK